MGNRRKPARQIWIASVVCAVMVCWGASASAWSTKEHILLTRLAAQGLISDPSTPPEMRQWLARNTPDAPRDEPAEQQWFLTQHIGQFGRGADGLAFRAIMPDLEGATDRRPIEPFGVRESKLHFLDVEQFNPDPAKRTYAPDLSHKPALADFPRNVDDPRYKLGGFLPFRVEQCYGRMVQSIRDGRLEDKPGQYPHDDNAVRWAGYLAHYIEDNTQPQHATVDYKALSYFHGAAGVPNIHQLMEYVMVDDDDHDYMELRREYWPELMKAIREASDPATSDDPWTSTIQVSLWSYDALPLIGQAAVAATHGRPPGKIDVAAFFHFKGSVDGRPMTVMQMKARQQALAVLRVRKLWLAAWRAASRH